MLFGRRIGESLSWWACLSGLICHYSRWSENRLNCYWEAKNRPKHYNVTKWSWTPNHGSGCRFFGWFATVFFLRKSGESSAKAVAKEKVSIEASSPHSTFAAASQVNVVNDETLLFPCGISPKWPCIYPWLSPGSLTQLPFAYCLSAPQQHKSG